MRAAIAAPRQFSIQFATHPRWTQPSSLATGSSVPCHLKQLAVHFRPGPKLLKHTTQASTRTRSANFHGVGSACLGGEESKGRAMMTGTTIPAGILRVPAIFFKLPAIATSDFFIEMCNQQDNSCHQCDYDAAMAPPVGQGLPCGCHTVWFAAGQACPTVSSAPPFLPKELRQDLAAWLSQNP
jgi:hypothetical protein